MDFWGMEKEIVFVVVMRLKLPDVFAPCKGIQDSFGFWIPRGDVGFQVLDSGFFISVTWIPDSIRWRDSGFLKLILGPGFRISQAKLYRIPHSRFISKQKNLPLGKRFQFDLGVLLEIFQHLVSNPSQNLLQHLHPQFWS